MAARKSNQKRDEEFAMFKRRKVQVNRVAAVALSLSLAFTAGCSRDPNVRKQKYLESGKRYEANGKYKEAAIQFSNALKVDKNFADAHYELAKTYIKMGSLMPAYSELLRAVHLAPTTWTRASPWEHAAGGPRQLRPRRGPGQRGARHQPQRRGRVRPARGRRAEEGDNAEALKDIQHALAIDPNRAAFHTALALLEAATPE
jgi:Tfp pilus assembly protein PilF